jgi:hypothetical protein
MITKRDLLQWVLIGMEVGLFVGISMTQNYGLHAANTAAIAFFFIMVTWVVLETAYHWWWCTVRIKAIDRILRRKERQS